MAKLLFRLGGVGEDEAEDVRQVLDEAGIPFYETNAGRWRISLAAIWLNDKEDYPRARAILDDYQEKRREHMQELAKDMPTMWESIKQRPVHFFFSIVAVVFVLALVLLPFLLLSNNFITVN